MNRKTNVDPSKMDEFNKTVNNKRAQFTRILDLQTVLKESARKLNERTNNIVYPETYRLVDQLPIASIKPSYARVIPEINSIIYQTEDISKVYISDVFEHGNLFQINTDSPVISAAYLKSHIYIFFLNKIIVVYSYQTTNQHLNLNLSDSQNIQFSTVISQNKYNYNIQATLSFDHQITAAASSSHRIFFADGRGQVYEILFENTYKISNLTMYIPIYSELFKKASKILQMCCDSSRNILYLLDENKQIRCYEVVNQSFKQIESKIIDANIQNIYPIQAQQSNTLNLASIDEFGKTSFYSLNESIPANMIDLSSVDQTENIRLKKTHAEKIAPSNRMLAKNFKILNNQFIYYNDDQVDYYFVDQSIKKQRKVYYESNQIITDIQQNRNERILDVQQVHKHLLNETPMMDLRYRDVNLCYQYTSEQKFIAIVTNQRVLVYTIQKLYQNVSEMLSTYQEIQVRQFLNEYFDELEVMTMMLFINCCYEVGHDVGSQILLQKQCLVQFNINQTENQFQIRNPAAQHILEDCVKNNGQLFLESVIMLYAKLLSPVYSYQLFYSPSASFQQQIDIDKYSIPIINLNYKDCKSKVQPIVLFNYIELFNLGVYLNNITNFLHKYLNSIKQSQIQQQQVNYLNNLNSNFQNQPNQLYNTNQMLNQYKSQFDTLSMLDLYGCGVFVKELVFFFSLCFMPGNCARVIPELIMISNKLSSGVIEAPLYQNIIQSNQSINPNYNLQQYQYINCPAMNFCYYLENNNKQQMEILVRKLNIILNSQTSNQIFKLNQQQYQQQFDQCFSNLCQNLSKIYQNRLSAIQDLEQACLQTCSANEKQSKVQSAVVKLRKTNKSLLPLEPLLELFNKVDSIKDLVVLILHNYDFLIKQIDDSLNKLNNVQMSNNYLNADKLTQLQSNYLQSFNNQLLASQDFYKKEQINYLFNIQQNEIVLPYKVESQFQELLTKIQNTFLVNQNNQKVLQQQFSANLNNVNNQLNNQLTEQNFQELKLVLEQIYNIIEKYYITCQLQLLIRNDNTELQNQVIAQQNQKGLSIVLAAIQGSTSRFWHIMLYQFIYLHYYNASCLLDLNDKKQNQAQFNSKQSIQSLHLIKKRCADVLCAVTSPYIEEFLLVNDYELYIKYLQKCRKTNQMLNYIRVIVENNQPVLSILPNQYEGGVWKTQQLNFYQTFNLIQLGASVLRIETSAQTNSLYNTSVISQFNSQMNESQDAQQQGLTVHFQKILETAKIQQELLDRLQATAQQNNNINTDQIKQQLLNAPTLSQKLRDYQQYDLDLILQYNIFSKIQSQYNPQQIEACWTQLLIVDPKNADNLLQDCDKLLQVLNRVTLSPIELKTPFYKIINNYQFLFLNQVQETASLLVNSVFRPKSGQKGYIFIGNTIKCFGILLQDYKNNQSMAEILGFAIFKLLEISRQLPNVPESDESVQAAQIAQRVKNTCANIVGLQEIMRKW